jgi:hypothetical protein
MMNFSVPNLVVSFLFSGLGYVYFSFGRKMSRLVYAISGLVLMVYPYFISSMGLLVAVGLVLAVIPHVATRWGW